jgi:hypothetical protein
LGQRLNKKTLANIHYSKSRLPLDLLDQFILAVDQLARTANSEQGITTIMGADENCRNGHCEQMRMATLSTFIHIVLLLKMKTWPWTYTVVWRLKGLILVFFILAFGNNIS